MFSRSSSHLAEMPPLQRIVALNVQAVTPERRTSRAAEFFRNAASALVTLGAFGGLLLYLTAR
jgi:hypothetical protein